MSIVPVNSFESLEFGDFSQDLYFHSNVCHVCKVFGDAVELKRCGCCKMIAYCGKSHQKEHWPQHKELCKILTKFARETGTTPFSFHDSKRNNTSMESWTQLKTNLMLLVQLKLGRKLLPYEADMFKHPRACTVCHETNLARLTDCTNCPDTSFCPDHKKNHNHAKKCYTSKLCFDIDNVQFSLSKSIGKSFDFGNLNIKDAPRNMKEAVSQCFYQDDNESLISTRRWTVYVTEYLTRPLTFLYAIEKLNKSTLSRINIHLIGANEIETKTLMLWEILLHYIKSLKQLRIILIGPELCYKSYQMDLCDECTADNKKILVYTADTLYSDYATASKYFVKPDYIIGYNLGIHECEDFSSVNDTWAPSVVALRNQDCPFIMTSYTLKESEAEQKRVKEILGERVEFFHSWKNPFASWRPYRDFETEDFFYANQYITIYDKLS